MRDLVVPIGVVGVIATMLVPLPPGVMDLLLAGNLVIALALLLTTLSVVEPLKLSALPSILLLATMYRLALNISTTRLILGRGDAGEVVSAFGSVVVQGNLVVGAVVFLVITLVQFIVIAKGSERVAEVAARFTLDALPGKQMSIDADVRAGLLDAETARSKRQELQTESRFYGALDGAMKFIKGDAIAGIVITFVNILGGMAVGLLGQGLSIEQAAERYSMLTIGDGLLSQIPSLLNSLAAGMIVTRVSREDGMNLAHDLVSQLSQDRKVKGMIAGLSLLLAFVPAMPAIPFLLVSLGLVVNLALSREKVMAKGAGNAKGAAHFRPKSPALLRVELSAQAAAALAARGGFAAEIEGIRARVFQRLGLLIPIPEFEMAREAAGAFRLSFRGIPAGEFEAKADASAILARVAEELERLVMKRAVECMDDIMTRRLLDHLEQEAPELVAHVIPNLISMTQLSTILRQLLREGIPILHLSLIVQAIAEAGTRTTNERELLQAARVGLKRVISVRFADSAGQIRGFTLDPILDFALQRIEKESGTLDIDTIRRALEPLRSAEQIEGSIVVTSRGARQLFAECLEAHGIHLPVLAHEELSDDVHFEAIGHLADTEMENIDALATRLAA